MRAAINRETEVKGWLRTRKVALIESTNRDRKDFSDGWYGKVTLAPVWGRREKIQSEILRLAQNDRAGGSAQNHMAGASLRMTMAGLCSE